MVTGVYGRETIDIVGAVVAQDVVTLVVVVPVRTVLPALDGGARAVVVRPAGRPSTSAAAWRVPSNPVHVLDLAFFFPAAWVSGVSLLRRRGLGCATAPGVFAFLALTYVPILMTPLVAVARGAEPSRGVVPPIGKVLLVSKAALVQMLRSQA